MFPTGETTMDKEKVTFSVPEYIQGRPTVQVQSSSMKVALMICATILVTALAVTSVIVFARPEHKIASQDDQINKISDAVGDAVEKVLQVYKDSEPYTDERLSYKPRENVLRLTTEEGDILYMDYAKRITTVKSKMNDGEYMCVLHPLDSYSPNPNDLKNAVQSADGKYIQVNASSTEETPDYWTLGKEPVTDNSFLSADVADACAGLTTYWAVSEEKESNSKHGISKRSFTGWYCWRIRIRWTDIYGRRRTTYYGYPAVYDSLRGGYYCPHGGSPVYLIGAREV